MNSLLRSAATYGSMSLIALAMVACGDNINHDATRVNEEDQCGPTDYPDILTQYQVGQCCGDGVDNDHDGLIDGNDPNCQNVSVNTEANGYGDTCSDQIDNDGDGDIDCADPDCSSSPNCQNNNGNQGNEGSESNECNDGKDNDGNGLTDCQEPACFNDPVCVEDADPGSGSNAEMTPVTDLDVVVQRPSCGSNSSQWPKVYIESGVGQQENWTVEPDCSGNSQSLTFPFRIYVEDEGVLVWVKSEAVQARSLSTMLYYWFEPEALSYPYNPTGVAYSRDPGIYAGGNWGSDTRWTVYYVE